jgi:hypothetical protein
MLEKLVWPPGPGAARGPSAIKEPIIVGGISDRKQEIKRRRQRRKKLTIFKRRLKKATVSEKAVIAEKLRKMTPGCEVIIANLGLEERK